LKEQLHLSLTETQLPHLLRYEDRNSMAFSIESRVPFLTAELAEFLYSLPDEHLVAPDGTSKAIFRKAMRGLVPDEILDRRDKVGFATPEQKWLSVLRPWVDRALQSPGAGAVAALNLAAVRQEWDAIVAGRKYFNHRVWRWVNLIEWSRRFEVSFQ